MTVCRIILSCLCAFGGYSACVAFLILNNYPSAILGFVTGIVESILTFLHVLNRKKKLEAWYSVGELNQICRLGITLMVVGLGLTIYFITMEVKTEKPIMPIDASLVLPLIWSIIVTRSSIVLIYYSVKYRKRHDVDRANLMTEEENVEYDDAPQTDEILPDVHGDHLSKSDLTDNTGGSTAYESLDEA